MKKFAFSIISIIAVLAITFVSATSLKAQADGKARKDYLQKSFNMVVTDNKNNNKINKDDALKIAEEASNVLSKEAENVTVSHYLMTYDGLTPDALSQKAKELNPKLSKEKGMDKLPVWIVTYDGLNLPAKGKGNAVMKEQNYVIDAETGEILFIFS